VFIGGGAALINFKAARKLDDADLFFVIPK